LIMGGQNSNSEILGDVWSYNPATNKWEEVDQDTAPSGRTGAGAVSSQDGFIYVFGGIQNPPMSLGSVWRFAPASGQWTIMGMENPAGPRYGHYMTQIGNKIYLVGGMQCTSGNFIQSYNLSGFEFTNVTPINQGPARRMNHAGATLGNDIYIFGGTSITNSRTLSDTWKFNTVTNAWQRLPNLPQAISDFNAAVVTDTVSGRRLSFMSADEPRFLLSRGIDASGGLVETSYIFDGVNYEPVEDGFSIFLPMVMWK